MKKSRRTHRRFCYGELGRRPVCMNYGVGVREAELRRRSTMPETESGAKPKPRPIIRIGLFLVAYSFPVSVICYAAGVFALLLLPVLAKNTYVSENALMPGSATPMLSNDDALEGHKFLKKIMNWESSSELPGIGIAGIIAEHITRLGGEANYHMFQPVQSSFRPLNFFLAPDTGTINENKSCSSNGINVIGIVRAPRGDGKEAIVMVTPYNSSKIATVEALSLGIAYSVFSLVSRVDWLSKDIIWLAADSKHGEYAAVASWLKDYNSLSFGDLNIYSGTCGSDALFPAHEETQFKDDQTATGFRRAGTMAAGIVIKVADKSSEYENEVLNIYAEASNGQMPNLDLINIVNYLAVHGQGFQVSIKKILSLLDSWWLHCLGELLEWFGNMAESLNPEWKFGIPVRGYVEGSATLARSLYNQALGVPTGPHGPFRDYQVDAITMEISSKFSGQQILFLTRVGRLVEGVIRSVNNLLEKFHQSFFLYLLTSPSRFVSVGVYMISFGLLVAPLPLVSAALFFDVGELRFKSWAWLNAAKAVLTVHLWGVAVALLPYFISKNGSLPAVSLMQWTILSTLAFFFINRATGGSSRRRSEWRLLKSATIAATFIGLCLMSVINFATAEIGALLLVPMCLSAAPLMSSRVTTAKGRRMQMLLNVLLAHLVFPPAAFLLTKGALDGFDTVGLSDFWDWVESLWVWSSATFLYVCVVHLPCWLLCIGILLLRS
ncbi:hypothetical protein M569_11711 [Genlisea aurea]|uniref:Glycosylphosphatidylinositol anchor attachment 1 protein n=1 Tax=Genlisea aurea TaxID=192259 RepID=S8DTD1_9LAMI|nr:hypothetical protein M569_11711 [Genlisea aurea]